MWHPICILSIILLLLFAGPVAGLMATSHKTDDAPAVIHIMAVVPTTNVVQGNVPPKWTNGEEILPGAHLAIQQIANNSDLLNGLQLKVIPVRIPSCNINEGIIPFVKELTSKDNNIVAIVGFFCQSIAQHFSQLLQHKQMGIVHISAMSLQMEGRDNFPNVQHSIISLVESVSRAALQLMHSLKWKNISVLSNQKLHYITAKYTFIKIAKEQGINIKVAFNIKTIKEKFEVILHELQRNGIKIIVAFVTLTEAREILFHAHHNGFKWPDYCWIFANEILHHSLSQCAAMNGAIFLQPELKTQFENDIPPSTLNYSTYHNAYLEYLRETATKLNVSLQSNPYANVMYDSIWAIALILNQSLNILEERNLSLVNTIHSRSAIVHVLQEKLSELSFQGVTGSLNFSQYTAALETSVQILQIQNGNPVHIGCYKDSLDQLLINDSNFNLRKRPNDTLNRVYVIFPLPLTVIMSVLVVMCFLLTTASMCLFLYYRKQPVIRATSSTLSLFVFLGSYILLLSTQFSIISGATIVQGNQGSLRTFICTFDIYFLGIGTDILFATVIAKTLRIYYIFKIFGKGSQICSDRGLLFLILSTVSIKIILLVTWTSCDINHLVDTEQQVTDTVPPYVHVTQSCQSKHLGIWISLQFGYSTALGLVMVLLAIMTRKIRRGNFKDSKEINMLVIALLLDAFLTMPLWIVLRISGATILSQLAYIVGTLLAAFFGQAFLILPKIGPLVLVKIQRMKAWKQVNMTANETV